MSYFRFNKVKTLAFLALKWPFIEQPENHIGWDLSMSFTSINPIFMEINLWKFGQKQFSIHKFTQSQFSNQEFKIQKFKIGLFFFLVKIQLKWSVGMVGTTHLKWLPWFHLNTYLLCVLICCTFYVFENWKNLAKT